VIHIHFIFSANNLIYLSETASHGLRGRERKMWCWWCRLYSPCVSLTSQVLHGLFPSSRWVPLLQQITMEKNF